MNVYGKEDGQRTLKKRRTLENDKKSEISYDSSVELSDANNQQSALNAGNMFYSSERCDAKYWGPDLHQISMPNAVMMEIFHWIHYLRYLLNSR
jgi:hypothetical protein